MVISNTGKPVQSPINNIKSSANMDNLKIPAVTDLAVFYLSLQYLAVFLI